MDIVNANNNKQMKSENRPNCTRQIELFQRIMTCFWCEKRGQCSEQQNANKYLLQAWIILSWHQFNSHACMGKSESWNLQYVCSITTHFRYLITETQKPLQMRTTLECFTQFHCHWELLHKLHKIWLNDQVVMLWVAMFMSKNSSIKWM